MAQKEHLEPDNMHIVTELEHRIKGAGGEQRTLEQVQTKHQKELENAKLRSSEIIKELHIEVNQLTETCHVLKRTVFTIGKQLRSKVSKRELEQLQERIDALQIENIPMSNELEDMYQHYSKQ